MASTKKQARRKKALKKLTRETSYFDNAAVNTEFLIFINTFGFNKTRVENMVKQLEPYHDSDRLEMIRQSLDRGWRGIYEVK